MSSQTWVEALITAQSPGTQLTDSTTPTSILPTQAKNTIPACTLAIGTVLRCTGSGNLSNVATTPGTLKLDLKFGTTIVFTTGAFNMSGTAHTTLPIWFEFLLTCRAVGGSTSANLMGQGRIAGLPINRAAGGTDPTTTFPCILVPVTTPAVGNGFDSTAPQQVDLFATFSVSTDPTNLQLDQWCLENMN